MLVKKLAILSIILCAVSAGTDGPWNILGQTGYAGEIDVNTTTGSSLFYWMFQSIGGNIQTDTRPLVIWLPGGPGCSLGLGMLGQRYSPFYVDSNGNPQFNNLTWALRVHILSVDFPYGTGYSSPTAWTDWVTNVQQGVNVFINFLDILNTKYPAWFNRDIYIVGQDFAGMFVPAIANQIHINNRNLTPGHSGYINLLGIALGDAWINGPYQSLFFDTFAFNEGLVNREQMNQITTLENYIIGNSSNPQAAFVAYQNLNAYIEQSTGNVNTFNYRSYSSDDFGNLNAFFNNPAVKLELNVPSNVAWTQCSNAVYSNLTSSIFVSQADMLATVLGYMNVLIYSSQDDLLINSMGTQYAIRALNWDGINDFLAARRGAWNVAGNIAGYAQTYSSLTYVQILKSGLGIGLDQTMNARDMLYRFIFNQGWN